MEVVVLGAGHQLLERLGSVVGEGELFELMQIHGHP